MKLFVLLFLMAFGTGTFAKDFANQYCQFTLPDGWTCQLEGSEWVCQSENADRKKEAIVILAAKIAGMKDRLEEYQAYLKAPKTFTLPGGKTQVSEAKYANSKTIGGQNWIDALHLASEVPGFYTRYLATVKEDLGVAVTFSVAKDYYATYQPVFDKMVETLKVFRNKQAGATQYVPKTQDNVAGNSVIDDTSAALDIGANVKQAKGGMSDSDSMLYIAIIVVVAVVVLMKLKKNKK